MLPITRAQLDNLKSTEIVDVWEDNFIQEMREISELLEEFNIIAMDTEFPGTEDHSPISTNDKENEYHYIYQNVKKFKLIQVGITLANQYGEVPVKKNTWNFNLRFRKNEPIVPCVQDMLQKAGINFDKLHHHGIDYDTFCDYLFSSGLILYENIKFIVFHGQYDFAYLLNLIHYDGLPKKSEEFQDLMKKYFPQIYDLKYAIQDNAKFKDFGLNKLAQKLDLDRIGNEHLAGSDALLTLQCFFRMNKLSEYNQDFKSADENMNIVYGIGKGYVQNNRKKNYQMQQEASNYYDYSTYYDNQYNENQYTYNYMIPQQYYNFVQQDDKRKYQ